MPERRNHKFSKQGMMLSWLVLLVFGALLVAPSNVLAAEMVTDGDFPNTTNWAIAGATYDAGTTHSGTSGSILGSIVNSRTAANFTVDQTAISIPAGSIINAPTDIVVWGMNNWDILEARSTDVEIILNYADATTVSVFTGTVDPTNQDTWQNLTNGTTGFPITLGLEVTSITVSASHRAGNDNAADSNLWFDDISITYTPPAGGTHNLSGFVDQATPVAPLNPNGTEYLFATVGSSAGGVGNDVTSWWVTVGGTVALADVGDIVISYGGSEVGRLAVPSLATSFEVTTAGSQLGGSDWTFNLGLDSGDTKNVSLTLDSATGGDTGVDGSTAGPVNLVVPAGCNRVDPVLTVGDQSISDAGSETITYTITLESKDNGGCAAEDYTIDIFSQVDSGTSFSGAVLQPAEPCTISALGEGLTDSATCTMEVTSAASPAAGETYTVTLEVTSTNHGAVQDVSVTTVSAGLGCDGCHGNPPIDGARNATTGAVVGSHAKHTQTWLTDAPSSVVCNTCHATLPTQADHRNGNIDMANPIAGGFYDRDEDGNSTPTSWPQAQAPVIGNCDNTTCHGNADSPNWGTAGPLGCDDCHGDPGNHNYPDAAAPFRDASATVVGNHETHMTATSTYMAGGVVCSDCHTVPGTTSAAGHFDTSRPANVDMTSGDGAQNSSTPAFTGGKCNSVYCHGGNMPGGTSTGTAAGIAPTWSTASTFSGCTTCHETPPMYLTVHTAGMVNDLTTCSACHDKTVDSTGNLLSPATFHINGLVEGGTCDSCHDVTGSASNPTVLYKDASGPVASDGFGSHLRLTRGEDLSGFTAAQWETRCKACHFDAHPASATPPAGSLAVAWDARSMGTDFTKYGVIMLKKSVADEATQAEICWNCHDNSNPDISEWDGSNATYDYGFVEQDKLDWSTNTLWTSAVAQFSYKTGPLNTRPVDVSANPGSNSTHTGRRAKASMHSNAGTYTPGDPSVDAVASVSCTACHDVHNREAVTSGPFIRGTWHPSSYPEDGAPNASTTIVASADYGAVPRANNTNSSGGWQIDQNNPAAVTANSGYVYTTDDSLCASCHTEAQITDAAAAPLHMNAVMSFASTGTADGPRNIFKMSDRSSAINDRFDPAMAYQSTNSGWYTSNYMGGFRESDAAQAAVGLNPTVGGKIYGYTAAKFVWDDLGLTTDSTTTDDAFHNFTCSKCHNPHASRLPRLMITNCLDVQRNTWDDQYKAGAAGGNTLAEWGVWGNLTPSSGSEGFSELAYSNTAQNCHRYFPAQTGTGSGIYEGKGWNLVTPW